MVEAADGLQRKRGRMFGVQRHARRCRWVFSAIKPTGGDRRATVRGDGEDGKAVRDARPAGHAAEQGAFPIGLDAAFRPTHKRGMDILRRTCSGEPHDPGDNLSQLILAPRLSRL